MIRTSSVLGLCLLFWSPALSAQKAPADSDAAVSSKTKAQGNKRAAKRSGKASADGSDAATDPEVPPPAEAVEEPAAPIGVDSAGNPVGSAAEPDQIESVGGDPNFDAIREPVALPQTSNKANYPISRALRLIILPHTMAQLRLDVPTFFSPFSVTGILGASYGVTDKIQVGLRYALGTQTDDGFTAGRTGLVEGRYAIFDWLAIQAGLPVNVDPFAAAITLGAPMQFTFYKTLRVEVGADLLSIKLAKFAPSVGNAVQNQTLAAQEANNQILPDADLNLNLNVFYQLNERQVIEGRFGTTRYLGLPSSTPIESPVQLSVGFMHSTSNRFDIGLRTGFAQLGTESDSFFVSGFLAYRL